MPINIEDTLWMRQQRIEQQKQEKLAAMAQIAEGSAGVNAIQQRAFEQEMEMAPQMGAVAQQTGQPVPQYQSGRLQQAAQMGAQGALAQQMARQRAQQVEEQARQQAHQFDMQKLTLEWANRMGMSSVEAKSRMEIEKYGQRAADARAKRAEGNEQKRLDIMQKRADIEEQKQRRVEGNQKLAAVGQISRLLRDAKGFLGETPVWEELPGHIQSIIIQTARTGGFDPYELLGLAWEEGRVAQEQGNMSVGPPPTTEPNSSMYDQSMSLSERKAREHGVGGP